MALAERHAFPDEVVGELGREHFGGERGAHSVGLGGQGGEHAGGDLDAVAEGLDVVDQRFDALLQVFVVGGWQTLDRHHEPGHLSEGPSALATQQFQAVWVLLLGHERTAG